MNARIDIVVDKDLERSIAIEIAEDKDGNRKFSVQLCGETTFYTIADGNIPPEKANPIEAAFRVLENTLLDYLDTISAELGINRSK